MEDGGFRSSGHFTEYRRALIDCGAIRAELDYHTARATTPNYEYTLNLDWAGAVAPVGTAVALPGRAVAPQVLVILQTIQQSIQKAIQQQMRRWSLTLPSSHLTRLT